MVDTTAMPDDARERGASSSRRRAWMWTTALLVVASLVAGLAFQRMMLWAFVNVCSVDQAWLGTPLPCLAIEDAGHGLRVAVVRPPAARKHLLVVPLTRIEGLEDDSFSGETAAAIVTAAWRERARLVPAGQAVPWTGFGLAINSLGKRTQDQLHVHVDCLTAEARAALGAAASAPRAGWSSFHEGRIWWKTIRPDELATWPLATWLADLPIARAAPLWLNLGLAGIIDPDGRPAWALLASRSRSLEATLDPGCSARDGQQG